jgi:hypothetical protein
LSEGIRVTVQMPPRGKIWRLGTAETYAQTVAQDVLKVNPGFAETSSSDSSVGSEPAKVLEFLGQNQNIQEPERMRLYLLARPECKTTIEVVSPAARFKNEEKYFSVFIKSFEFKRCPNWTNQ